MRPIGIGTVYPISLHIENKSFLLLTRIEILYIQTLEVHYIYFVPLIYGILVILFENHNSCDLCT